MLDLAQRLGCDRAKAVGTVELLLHFVARYAPAGDIGKWTDDAIARAVDWRGEPSELVSCLADSRWLDHSEEHRFIVHDWSEHADDSIHMTLARAVRLFADGSIPQLRRLGHTEREKIEPKLRELCAQNAHNTQDSVDSAHDERTALAFPRLSPALTTGEPAVIAASPGPEEYPIPDGLNVPAFLEAWRDWHAYRRERKLCAWKPRTISAKLSELAAIGHVRAVSAIRFSIGNGYQGIFEQGGRITQSPAIPTIASPPKLAAWQGSALGTLHEHPGWRLLSEYDQDEAIIAIRGASATEVAALVTTWLVRCEDAASAALTSHGGKV
jgi:hypothetical protein